MFFFGFFLNVCENSCLYNFCIMKLNRLISLVGRMFANGPGHVIPKTLKMVLDTSLLNTQHYKVCIKSKVEQSRERSSALSYTSV